MKENERGDEAAEAQSQQVWSWGAGTEGQLGTGKVQDEHQPQLLSSLSSFGPISFLSCGGAHVIALTPGGRVFTWGRGTSGQLGHGDNVNSLQPKPVNSLENFIITHVSAGWNHSGFVSDTGCLFTCGDGSFGQLGHGDNKSQCCPVKVSHFTSRHIEQVACGMRHSIALLKGDSGDQVYGFGSGKRGQLGVSKDKIRFINLPLPAVGLKDIEIVSISANGDHSAGLSADGHLYCWGRGFSSMSDVYYPHCVAAPLSFIQVALGWNHALVLTGENKVFMLGGKQHGVLNNPQTTNVVKNVPHDVDESEEAIIKRIPELDTVKVLQISAGSEHSAIVADNKLIMTWGWAEHGQLGLGNTEDQTSPQVVSLGSKVATKHTTCKVYCGSGFTFAISA